MSQPLKGLKVLDFSTLLPGPYATQLLADMGAQILRVEAPKRPDLLKVMPPMVGKVSAAHATINRNKDCIALDLKDDRAKEIIRKLISEYDVIIEQFRPGVMKRLGLDYDSLKVVQPKLIYCSITGYGQEGPLKDRAGHDINYLALSGLASFSGNQGTGPVLSGTQVADIAGGSHHAVMAILAAVIERSQTSEGQFLDICMTDAAFALTTMFGASALASNKSPECGGEMLNGGLFYDYYRTKDDRFISIGSLEPVFASALLNLLGLSDWLPKVVIPDASIQGTLKSEIQKEIIQQNLAYWEDKFSAIDACVEPVLTLNEAAKHPHFVARKMVTTANDAHGNEISQINTALPFDRDRVHVAGKPLGSDTEAVLKELGYSLDEISQMRDSDCIK